MGAVSPVFCFCLKRQPLVCEVAQERMNCVVGIVTAQNLGCEEKGDAVSGVDQRKGCGGTVPTKLTHGRAGEGKVRLQMHTPAKPPALTVQAPRHEVCPCGIAKEAAGEHGNRFGAKNAISLGRGAAAGERGE